ncbi:MAG: indole-3-glycerol phosphate synthase TrpC [Deltaproteobacteria bacterium]|nr:indole-3-glycerol phosphate synthase TrpC [Deltaproteobacteria bacterium]
MILDDIVAHKREEVFASICARPLSVLKELIHGLAEPRGFAAALTRDRGGQAAVIAEVKKASPSKGVIREQFDPVAIAREYEAHGAAAISVLTEQRFFQGSPGYLPAIRKQVCIPVLRKDFLFDIYQIYEARSLGADALLLIAAILEKDKLCELLCLTRELGMDALVEVHTREELDRVLATGARIIGINNRNLSTFKTDIATTVELVRGIPDDRIVVSESGIGSRADILMLSSAGVDAFLIGESLMRQESPGARLAELIDV